MYKYERKVEYAGGVNVPKIIFCIGSDGRRYKQLCKVSFIIGLVSMNA